MKYEAVAALSFHSDDASELCIWTERIHSQTLLGDGTNMLMGINQGAEAGICFLSQAKPLCLVNKKEVSVLHTCVVCKKHIYSIHACSFHSVQFWEQ